MTVAGNLRVPGYKTAPAIGDTQNNCRVTLKFILSHMAIKKIDNNYKYRKI